MKKYLSLVLVLILFTGTGFAKKKERLLICGCNWNKIAQIDKASGRILWSHPVLPGEDCNDIERTKQGAILYAYQKGARLIRENHKVVWDYKAPEKAEVYTATELPDGRFMITMCGSPAQIVFLNKQGEVVKTIPFDPGISNIHDQFRQIVLRNSRNGPKWTNIPESQGRREFVLCTRTEKRELVGRLRRRSPIYRNRSPKRKNPSGSK